MSSSSCQNALLLPYYFQVHELIGVSGTCLYPAVGFSKPGGELRLTNPSTSLLLDLMVR